MGTGRRIGIVALSALAAILFIIVVVLLAVSTTDWGRERVRRLAVDQLQASVHGRVEVGRVEGSLLEQVRISGLDVCRALDLRDVIFVGHSVSSMVGVLAANREPERFARLILVGDPDQLAYDAPGGDADVYLFGPGDPATLLAEYVQTVLYGSLRVIAVALTTDATIFAYSDAVAGSTRRRKPLRKSAATSGSPTTRAVTGIAPSARP